MRLRRAAVAVLGLVTLLPLLAACGGDAAELEVGDIVPARDDSQFAEGTPDFLALPIGRLEVHAGEPVRDLSARDTRELTATSAPEGATFVPITWQYDAATFGDYATYLGTPMTPIVELVSRGARYRLAAPAEAGEGSESFYVVVTGSGTDAQLTVDFDGVVQTLDLMTGERDEGDAAALYEVEPARGKTTSCAAEADFHGAPGFPGYICEVSPTRRLPYAAGQWADPGRTWLVLSVTTALRRYDVQGTFPGSGALYRSDRVRSTYRLGENRPVGVIPGAVGSCPDRVEGGCTSIDHLVFDVPDEALPPLEIDQRFRLVLGSQWRGFEGKERFPLRVSVTVPMR